MFAFIFFAAVFAVAFLWSPVAALGIMLAVFVITLCADGYP